MRAFESERAVAVGLRMTLAEEAQAPAEKSGAIGGVWSRRIAIGARECVAVIATTYGHHSPVALALQARSDDASGMVAPLSLTRAEGGLVAQVQWCEAEAHTRVAVFETRALTPRVFERPLTATVHSMEYAYATAQVAKDADAVVNAYYADDVLHHPIWPSNWQHEWRYRLACVHPHPNHAILFATAPHHAHRSTCV